MKSPPIRLGPLALLLTVISICLTVLAILTFTTARADMRLAEKYAETIQARYALEKDGQEYLCRLNAGRENAPDPDEDGVRRTELERGGFMLHIALRDDGQGGWEVLSWRHEKIWEQKETIDNLWSGSFGKEG
ncbi:MAG: hypothetical protein IJQ43_09015 [Oscillospiraceae bacterium]|nr:hypothetical protein [Oscillospiraceae bacterium]